MTSLASISRAPVSAALVLLLFAAAPAAQYGDGYQIAWWTVDGGGPAVSAAGYALRGTVGQPDADVLTGGDYTLAGGFWGGGPAALWRDIYLPVLLRGLARRPR